jgi:hypothetical protein
MTGERTTIEWQYKDGERVRVIRRGKFEGAEFVQTEESVTVDTGTFKALRLEPESKEVFKRD